MSTRNDLATSFEIMGAAIEDLIAFQGQDICSLLEAPSSHAEDQ